ncbi:MAG TPA: phosphatase PAP2 family protein [Armatimonadaceae bacterium]|nr:phosphatase PAP2 family protein [Armatimonadaceae bacterium]
MSGSGAGEGKWSWGQVALARRREAGALAVMIALLLAFGLLLYAIRDGNGERILATDVRITRAIQSYRSAPLDAAAHFFTFVGGFAVMAPVAVTLGALLLRQGRPRAALLLGTALLAGHPLNFALKMLARRPRPSADQDLVDVLAAASGTSFPSGHAMSAALFFGLIGFFAYVMLPSPRGRALVGALMIALALLVGLSRVYVGGHWFSDVVGGWSVGLFLLIAFAEAYRLIGARELAATRRESTPPPELFPG